LEVVHKSIIINLLISIYGEYQSYIITNPRVKTYPGNQWDPLPGTGTAESEVCDISWRATVASFGSVYFGFSTA
jgi:hypothetical protein